MASPAGRMRVGIAVVLVPDWGHVARIGFEEQLWHGVQPLGWLRANRADLVVRRLIGWQLDFDDRPAVTTLKIVAGHQSASAPPHSAQTPQTAR